MIEKFINVSQVRSYYVDLVNFVSSIDSKYGRAIMPTTSFVILSNTFIWMYVKWCWRLSSSKLIKPFLIRPMSLEELHGGDVALQGFCAHQATMDNMFKLEALLKQEDLNFIKLQVGHIHPFILFIFIIFLTIDIETKEYCIM